MEWETEGRRRKGRPLGTRIDGIRCSMESGRHHRQRRMEKKDFLVEIPVRIV
jgi:hypothetical protein